MTMDKNRITCDGRTIINGLCQCPDCYKPRTDEHVYIVKICISGEVAVYHKTAPSWQRARHLATVNAMKQYGKGFAEIYACDYDVKQLGTNIDTKA
jgi:hypothetical protein